LAAHSKRLYAQTTSLSESSLLQDTLANFAALVSATNARTREQEANVRQIRESAAQRRAELLRARGALRQAEAHLDTVVAPTVARLVHAAGALEEVVAMERRKRALELHDVLPMIPSARAGQLGSVAGLLLPLFDDKDHTRQLALSLSLIVRACACVCVADAAWQARAMMILADYVKVPLPNKMAMDKGVVYLSHFDQSNDVALLPWTPGFGVALKMLWRNMATLCHAQGVPSNLVSSRDFISNMWQLFHSPSLGRSVRQALVDAYSRESRNPVTSADDADFVIV
jgi:hypothetical protein